MRVFRNHINPVSPAALAAPGMVIRRAALIAGLYAVLATLWIYFSDSALVLLFDDPQLLLRWSVFKGLAFVAVTAVLLFLLMWWSFGAIHVSYLSLRSAQDKLHRSETQLSSIVASAMDAIVALDQQQRIMVINPAAKRMFRCGEGEVLGTPVAALFQDTLRFDVEGTQVLTALRRGNQPFPVEVSQSSAADNGALMTLIIRDISKRRADELELQRMYRLYSALSRINQALLRTPARDELLRNVCRVLVDDGGLHMAWLGWHDATTGQLEPVARWGHATDYLDASRIMVSPDSDSSGPSVTAFRAGRAYICNDIAAELESVPWRAAALQCGFRACAAFPVRQEQRIVGTLSVYADAPGYFQPEEIDLLEGASADISVALETLALDEERREAEAEAAAERLFSETMIESLPGILYFYDEDGRMLRWNKNFEKVSGYRADELVRMHPLDFFADAERSPVAEGVARVFESGESYVEAPFVSRDGTATPYFFTGRRILFDGKPCLVGIGIDVSGRRNAEKALRELNETLELRVVERTNELQIALVRAEAADRLKSAFLATMSHELRTPLNSIIGFTGIVLQGLAGPVNEEQQRQLGMVRNSARHLLDLINDVLDLSKIEAGQLEIRSEPVDLRASIIRAVDMVRPMAEQKSLAMEVDVAELPPLTGDSRRIEQVLVNLLNNAVKFTTRGSVMLRARTVNSTTADGAPAGPQAVTVCIADTGMGIRKSDLDLLFRPFSQLDMGLSRQHEGTGLGLAICKRLLTLMGCRIDVASEWGQGSEFTVTLPLRGEQTS